MDGLKVNDPKFMDPLFLPYYRKYQYKTQTPYPLVDQRRYALGNIFTTAANANVKGQAFRTKQRMCPNGWYMSNNQMCIPYEYSVSSFYAEPESHLISYSNHRVPYNDYRDRKYDKYFGI